MEEKLKRELPFGVFKKLKFDKPPYNMSDSKFAESIVNNGELIKLEKKLNEGCINDKSLYNLGKPGKVNGYNVRIYPKGTYFYKYIPGFVTKEMNDRFLSKYSRPSWFSNVYVAYSYAREGWGCILPYKSTDTILLLDWFDEANLKKIIGQIHDHSLIKNIKLLSGYQMTAAEQLKMLNYMNPKWNELWFYTKPMFSQRTYFNCDIKKIHGINPISLVKSAYFSDLEIFKSVINNLEGIDGIIRTEIYSSMNTNGVFGQEEVVIRNKSQKNKITLDTGSKLFWKHWKFKNFAPPKQGISLNIPLGKVLDENSGSINENYKLIRFYEENSKCKMAKIKGTKNIFSYNVHQFINLNAEISVDANMQLILKLIEKVAKYCSVLVFQELEYYTFQNKKTFEDRLKKLGYGTYYYAMNGGKKSGRDGINVSYIGVFSKTEDAATILETRITQEEYNYSIKTKKYILPSSENYTTPEYRGQIIINNSVGKIAIVHLPIGVREILNIEKNKEIRMANSNNRIINLHKIIKHSPDIIIGDFNFTITDPETLFLKEKGYQLVELDMKKKSTPHNRVDLCFIKGSIKIGKNILLECNYSDHLPMIQEFSE